MCLLVQSPIWSNCFITALGTPLNGDLLTRPRPGDPSATKSTKVAADLVLSPLCGDDDATTTSLITCVQVSYERVTYVYLVAPPMAIGQGAAERGQNQGLV